jgi:hypothetical protein
MRLRGRGLHDRVHAAIESACSEGDTTMNSLRFRIVACVLAAAFGSNPNDADAIPAVGSFPAPYCGWGAQGVSPISRVQFAGIANDSDPAYNHSPELEDFTPVLGATNAGTSESIRVAARTWYDEMANPSTLIAVYFDWNQDGDFDDAGEVHVSPTIYGSGLSRTIEWQGSIDIPRSALKGATRMRVVASGSYNFNTPVIFACGNLGSGGQAEDYTVIVDSESIFTDDFE